jgi:hypothetical protein
MVQRAAKQRKVADLELAPIGYGLRIGRVDPPNGSESRHSVSAAYDDASDERSYDPSKVRFSATVGEEPEVEVALL